MASIGQCNYQLYVQMWAALQTPTDCKAELGKLANLITQGPMQERTTATKEVEDVLEADPTVTRYAS